MNILKTVTIKGFGKKQSGKVRDYYIYGDKRILITTDRISAFDRILGFIPAKGQVLNQLSAFWFQKTQDIIQNHLLAVVDLNVMIVKNAIPIPIEMVVRGYISGVTNTSIWGSYAKGERRIYGILFPEGLKKNQKLETPVITPTTKAEKGHDERLTREQIIKQKIVPEKIYQQMEKAALALFLRGATICGKAGIILVDTKYEFGMYNNELILIDEIHTPDSSRFWIKKTYKQRFKKGEEPENFDKEFLRIWYKNHGYTGDGRPPKMPHALIMQVSMRYRQIFEKITNTTFKIKNTAIQKRIADNLSLYKESQKPKLALLISNKGKGTNLQAIIDAIAKKKLQAQIAVVISDDPKAYGVTRAKKQHIPVVICDKKEKLQKILHNARVSLVILAGCKQIIPENVLTSYPNRIINIHPGSIPLKKGSAIMNPDNTTALWNKGKLAEKAIEAFLREKATYAGVTIHFVTNDLDFGTVLQHAFVKIKKNDTVVSLYSRVKKQEHILLINALCDITNAIV